MALYEHVFLARQDITSQQVDALVEQYKGVIEANGGKVGRIENWGLKSLTYRIKKNRKAHYALMEDGPSAMMQKRDRDDRGPREGGDRGPRREFGDRPPRRDGEFQRGPRPDRAPREDRA